MVLIGLWTSTARCFLDNQLVAHGVIDKISYLLLFNSSFIFLLFTFCDIYFFKEFKMKVNVETDVITKIEKKKTIIDNVFGFTNEERNLLNHLFIIFLERIAVDDGEQTYILLDKNSEKSNLMFMYITCLYACYKSMGEADLTFSNIDEIKGEVFDFVYKLNDMLGDLPLYNLNDTLGGSPIGNVVSLILGDDGYYIAITKA